MNTFLKVVTFQIIFLLVLMSCQSNKQDAGGKISTKEVNAGGVQVPEFYLNPPKSDDLIYGVGSGDLVKLDASRKLAIARARDDIAFQISARIKSSISDYYQESGSLDEVQVLNFVETVSKQVTDTTLKGTVTEQVSVSEEGIVYALVSFPVKNLLEEAENAFVRNETAAFAEFKADEALKRLEADITANPLLAGQTIEQ